MNNVRLYFRIFGVIIFSAAIQALLFPFSALSAAPFAGLHSAGLSVTPDPFSPNGDGRLDVVKITSALNIQGTGQTANAVLKGVLTVNDSSGNQVASLELGEQLDLDIGKWNEAALSAVWDGKAGSGLIAADGVYFYTVDLSLLRGCKGYGDNRDDLHSGHVDLLGDCNSGEGNDSRGERVIASAQPMTGEITIDNTPPAIIVVGISADEVTNKEGTITISVEDQHLASQTILLNDQPFSSGTKLTEEGQYVLSVIADDRAENVSTRNMAFTIDKTAPVIEIVSPEAEATIGDSSLEIFVKFADSLSGVDFSSISVLIDGIDVTIDANISEEFLTYVPEPPLADGSHRMSVSVSDEAGNAYERSVEFVIKTKKRPFIFPEPGFKATDDDSYSTSRAPETVDINNDGVLDLVLLNINDGWSYNDSTRVAVMMGKGDGSFESPESIKEVKGNADMALNDFNGDGYPDIVLANTYCNSYYEWINGKYHYEIQILLNNQDGSFLTAKVYIHDKLAHGRIITGDFNQDNHKDAAVVSAYGKIQTFLGNGDGSLDNPVETNVTGLSYNQSRVSSVTSIDLNGDNTTDIAVAYGNVLFFLVASGDGTFNPIKIEEADQVDYIYIRGADVDNDGNMDIIYADEYAGVHTGEIFGYSVLLGDGEGGVRERKRSSLRLGPHSADIFLGEVTEDNIVDLLVVDNGYSVEGVEHIYVLKGNDDGTFDDQSPMMFHKSSFVDARNMTFADTDNDGFKDIVTALFDKVFILFGKGDGTFWDQKPIFTLYGEREGVISADIDNDNAPDLAFVGGSEGALFSTILNKGSAWTENLFKGSSRYRVGDGPSSVKVSDLNGDGKPDVATANYFSNDVSVLMNNDNGGLKIPVTYPVVTSLSLS